MTKPPTSIYMDHAATTPLDPEVKKAMEPFWSRKFGNPSSLYRQGLEARNAIDNARTKIAKLINARPQEIIFTAGGTESVNLAIFGVARMDTNLKANKHEPRHLIAPAIEHHCVIKSFEALASEAYKTTLVGVDREGFIKIGELRAAIRPETVLVSVMLANNEIGTVEPVQQIGKLLKHLNQERRERGLGRIFFHTDACQGAGFLDLNVEKLGVDLMSVNGSKIYGPKQTGFLYVRGDIKLKPLIYGGGQEHNLRSGTENVPGIVGLAKALELAQKRRNTENQRLGQLRDYLILQMKSKIKNILLNGPDSEIKKVSPSTYKTFRSSKLEERRLPNNINFTIKDVEGEALVLYLDSYGIAASTASACTTGVADPSHVLLALGRSKIEAKSSIRFSLGQSNTKSDIDYLLKVLPGIVNQLRKSKNLLN